MTALAVREVTFRHGTSDPVLDGVDLVADAGELVAIGGPSGCGKTTLLRIIAGLLTPERGDVTFDGASVLSQPPEHRGAAMVFQDHTLFPFRTVAANVAFGLRVRRVPAKERRERVAAALDEVQLGGYAKRWPAELSGGQRQRVALARALVVRPRLLLLDEPLSSLDPELRSDLRQTIRRIQREHAITTVMVTHDRSDAEAIADRTVALRDGMLTGTTAN
ncbi:MAG: ABC transporter ATP-binding protein [Actinomycetota bacterium]